MAKGIEGNAGGCRGDHLLGQRGPHRTIRGQRRVECFSSLTLTLTLQRPPPYNWFQQSFTIKRNPNNGMKNVNLKPRIKATANIAKNRLHITMSGNVDSKSLEKLYTDIRFCVADLKKGFEVISDISQCNILYVGSFPNYKKIIDYLIANNVGEIVRIIRNANISYKQILKFSEKIDCYKTIYVESDKEAEDKLQLLIKRNGVRFKIDNLFFEYTVKDSPGKGRIIDISTSGCAVDSPTPPLTIDTEIVVIIKFSEHDTLLSIFTIKAKVVRVDDQRSAIQFIDLDDDHKNQLYNRLAYEVSRSTYSS